MRVVRAESDELHGLKAHAQQPRGSAHREFCAFLMIGQFMQRHGFADTQVNIATVEK